MFMLNYRIGLIYILAETLQIEYYCRVIYSELSEFLFLEQIFYGLFDIKGKYCSM